MDLAGNTQYKTSLTFIIQI